MHILVKELVDHPPTIIQLTEEEDESVEIASLEPVQSPVLSFGAIYGDQVKEERVPLRTEVQPKMYSIVKAAMTKNTMDKILKRKNW